MGCRGSPRCDGRRFWGVLRSEGGYVFTHPCDVLNSRTCLYAYVGMRIMFSVVEEGVASLRLWQSSRAYGYGQTAGGVIMLGYY